MSASLFDLRKYAATGLSSPDVSGYDKLHATASGGSSPHTGMEHYGFKIEKSVSDPFQNVQYLYDAIGYEPAYMDYARGAFNYGSWLDAFFIKNAYPVALKYDGTEDYRLDPDDYSKKLDGAASDVSDSSYPGNFMMAIPLVWVKRYDDGNFNYIEISNDKLDDDFLAYAHTDRNGEVKDHIYLPLFKGSLVDGKIRSIAGAVPNGKIALKDMGIYISANGYGWQAWDHSSRELICDLLTLIGKSTDSQTTFGKGQVLGYDASATDYGFVHTGSLKDKGMFYGYNTDYSDVKVFGIEGFWGTRLDFMLGLAIKQNAFYIKMTPPYNQTYTSPAGEQYSGVCPSTDGYLRTVDTSIYGSIPSLTGGTSSTYFCDYYTRRADTGWYPAYPCVGGANDGNTEVGFRYMNLHPDYNAAYPNVGFSLIYK